MEWDPSYMKVGLKEQKRVRLEDNFDLSTNEIEAQVSRHQALCNNSLLTGWFGCYLRRIPGLPPAQLAIYFMSQT
jgi:hypothetical protein